MNGPWPWQGNALPYKFRFRINDNELPKRSKIKIRHNNGASRYGGLCAVHSDGPLPSEAGSCLRSRRQISLITRGYFSRESLYWRHRHIRATADNSNRQLPFFVAPKASHTLGAFVLAILGNRDRNKIAHSVDWVDDCKAQRKGTGGIDARRKNN